MSAYPARDTVQQRQMVAGHHSAGIPTLIRLIAGILLVSLVLVPVTVRADPLANDDEFTVQEDSTNNPLDVLANDAPPDGLTIVAVTQGDQGGKVAIIDDNTRLSYTPESDFFGLEQFTYTVHDDGGISDTARVYVTVNGVNDPPTVRDDSDVSDEDTPVTIDVLDNDEDSDGNIDPSSVNHVSGPSHGTVVNVDPTTGQITYRPDSNWYGLDSFTYEACDDGTPLPPQCRGAEVSITVREVNDPPWIDPIVPNRSADEDTAIEVDLSAHENDLESSGTDLDWSASGQEHCMVSGENSDDDILTFTPDANYNGSDIVLLTLTDVDGSIDTQIILLTWTPINDAPDLDLPPGVSLDEDTSLDNDVDMWAYTTDPETADSGLTFSIENTPAPNAGVSLDGSRYIDIQPAANWHGATNVQIKVTDPEGLFITGTFRVTVRNVNDNPQANTDHTRVKEDSTNNWIDVLSNDTYLPDPFETLLITSATNGRRGRVTVQNNGGRLAYTPGRNYYGRDSFTYTISDGHGGVATATVDVTVSNVNDDPLAGNDTAQVEEDSGVNQIDVLPNDTYQPDPPETLTIVGYTNAQHGTVTIVDDGNRLTYRPDHNFAGTDAFAYTISDGHGGYDTARVDVTVTGINDRPIARDDSAATDEDTPITIDVLRNDIDIDGLLVPSTVQVTHDPAHGSTSVNANDGRITYTPAPDWNGYDSFSYRVCDNGTPLPAQCDTARVDVAVGAVNDLPVSDAGADRTVDTLTIVTLDGSASHDPDGHLPLTYQWSQVGGAHITLSSTGVVSPTFAAPDDPAVLTFALRVIDSQGQADLVPDQVVVTITNQPPVADAGRDQDVLIGATVTLAGSRSVDPDHDLPLTYLWTQTGGPSVELSDAGAPSPTFVAPDEPAVLTFSLLISDALGEPALQADEVIVTVREPYLIYMPLIANRYAIAPDLVIQSVTATSNDVQVVIVNVGDAAVSHEFWVDAYINPRIAPWRVNQAWWDLGDEGLAWWVSGPALAALVPGGSATLRIHDSYYIKGESRIKTWPLPVGTTLYVQVDSYDPGTTYGMVPESHEVTGQAYNNIRGPVHSTAATSAGATPPIEYGEPGPPGGLPPRR